MNPLIQFEKATSLFFIMLALLHFGLLPKVQAVNPKPDGCYHEFTTAEGCDALMALTSGAGNTGLGWHSLQAVTTGSYNTGVGAGTLIFNTGSFNTAVGAGALVVNTSGSNNTAVGRDALSTNLTGTFNTAVGVQALLNSTAGDDNTALGHNAGANQDEGSNCVYIGAGVVGVPREDNSIHIADNLPTTTGASACFIGGIFGQNALVGSPVYINDAGKLGNSTSSRRFKHDIKPMDKASEAILALKPVTFHYKNDAKNTQCFGLIAEDVAAANPDLIVRDKEGNPYSVRYDQINAMLLNEFLKEHRTVQEQGAIIARLEKQVEALTAGLQKVSAQLELSKPAPQTVLNNQ